METAWRQPSLFTRNVQSYTSHVRAAQLEAHSTTFKHGTVATGETVVYTIE